MLAASRTSRDNAEMKSSVSALLACVWRQPPGPARPGTKNTALCLLTFSGGGRGVCNMCNASSAAFFRRKCSQLFLAHVTSRLAAFRLVLCMFFLVCLFCFLFPNVLQDEPVSSSCKTHRPLLEVFLSCNNQDTLPFLPLWLNHLKCGSPFSVSVWKDWEKMSWAHTRTL